MSRGRVGQQAHGHIWKVIHPPSAPLPPWLALYHAHPDCPTAYAMHTQAVWAGTLAAQQLIMTALICFCHYSATGLHEMPWVFTANSWSEPYDHMLKVWQRQPLFPAPCLTALFGTMLCGLTSAQFSMVPQQNACMKAAQSSLACFMFDLPAATTCCTH